MTYEPEIIIVSHFSAEEIIFDEGYDVTINGRAFMEDGYYDIILSLPFNELNSILSFCDKKGIKIAEIIGDKLSQEENTPIVLDLLEILNEPLEVDKVRLYIYHAMEEDEESGELIETEDEIYFLDELEEKDEDEREQENHTRLLWDTLIILMNGYIYYEQLVSSGMKESEAKKRAGLTDPIVFKIAHHFYFSRETWDM